MISRLSQMWLPVVRTSMPISKRSSANGRRDAETGGRVLSVGENEVDGVLLHQRWKAIFDDGSPRPAENVTNKKNAHEPFAMVPRVWFARRVQSDLIEPVCWLSLASLCALERLTTRALDESVNPPKCTRCLRDSRCQLGRLQKVVISRRSSASGCALGAMCTITLS